MPESLTRVFSCEFCEISRNTFFKEHLWMTASEMIRIKKLDRFTEYIQSSKFMIATPEQCHVTFC